MDSFLGTLRVNLALLGLTFSAGSKHSAACNALLTNMSHVMRKPAFCIYETKRTDQQSRKRTADYAI